MRRQTSLSEPTTSGGQQPPWFAIGRDDHPLAGLRQDRAARGERVRARPGGRGDDDPVAGVAHVQLAVDVDLDDHLPGALADDDDVVDRGAIEVAVPGHPHRGQAVRAPLAAGDAVERLGEVLGRSRGQRAEAAARDAEHGPPGLRGGVERVERRAVAAERDHEVAVGDLAGVGDHALLARDLDLVQAGAVGLAPRPDAVERGADLAARVDDEADAPDLGRGSRGAVGGLGLGGHMNIVAHAPRRAWPGVYLIDASVRVAPTAP